MNKIQSFFSWILASKIRLILALVLLIGAGFGTYKLFLAKSAQPQYQTATVEKGSIVASVSASGSILSANFVPLTTQAQGTVTQVYIKDGQQVIQGQKLMDIDLTSVGAQKNASNWAAYLSAKNALTTAQTNLFTLQSTMFSKWNVFMTLAQSTTYQNADGSPNLPQRQDAPFNIAQDDWLAAQATYANQQSVVSQTQSSLNSAWLAYQASAPTITAPQAGKVTDITAVPGMSIDGATTAQRVAVIRSEGNPLATFNLSEIDVASAKVGQKATITLDSLPNRSFTGAVMSVDHVGSTTSNVTNYPVIIQFDTNNPEILPNMTASANIITQTKENVLLVPSSAIQTQSGQSVVRILKNNQVQNVTVETGLSSDTQTEIVSGLSEGETVITGTVSTTSSSGNSPFSTFGSGNRTSGGNAVRVIGR
ncbi:hypothetical protein A2160_01305 [Candidatus Beckwithbacteria bacterium RBG_13_42_9]|uniref:Uncharacterized protein n=1 Tax=Candidatus Beckwithbacteria bacterium RBG_13_42_9 TaxID=1797457 RepID=A0A1F5E453_9BACT|nr:MAG: hypothetical protein A2160_01305 [Candidatus Beckwithbacteria bacterium RBG_13_42_9]